MQYDVIIIGGGTAGCSAAYNCAVRGIKTLLLEKSYTLGGTMTTGLVVPIMKSGENQINIDFYNKLITEMRNIGAQITYQGNSGWLNPELLKIVLDKILLEAGVEILFNIDIEDVKISSNNISSIKLKQKSLSVHNASIHTNNISSQNGNILSAYIETRYLVDATGNANFCQKINCDFLENKIPFPPMSLRFIMGGVDLKSFGDWLLEVDSDRDVTSVEVIDGVVHLSTACTWDSDKHWALAKYFDLGVKNGDLKDSDRNYFQVFSIAGMPNSIAFNCPRIVENLDPNDVNDVSRACIEGRQAIFRISNFCKKYFKGFENAYISSISDMIGIRASNRIKGKYIYSINDLRSGKKFKNPALISNYPVDVHSTERNSSTLEFNGEYQLPIESLMSANYDNLYVVGRSLSADEMAQGALRVQASCFSMGEAVAKHIKSRI